MKNFLSRFNQFRTVVKCPVCQQKLRVPKKLSKVIRVTCTSCHNQFDVQFSHPLAPFLKYKRSLSVQENMKRFFVSFQGLPLSAKLVLMIFILSLGYFLFSIVFSLFANPPLPDSASADFI